MTKARKEPSLAHMVAMLLTQFTWRHWRQHPIRALLLVGLLSLGVGVFFSIRLANRAAVASFNNFAEAVTQQTDAVLSARAGTLPESFLDVVQAELEGTGVEIIPVVEALGATPRTRETESIGSRGFYTVLGVDLVALQNYAAAKNKDRSWFGQPSPEAASKDVGEFWKVLNSENAVFCAEPLTTRLAVGIGATIEVQMNDRLLVLQIAGIIPRRDDQPAPPDNLLVADLPVVQKLSGKIGQLDRIEFIFPPETSQSTSHSLLLAKLNRAAGESNLVRTPESRRNAAEVMTRGFRLNLTILSLIALLVGLYLIFQTLDAAVVRRRSEIAILRALGVAEKHVEWAWHAEALLLGVVGGIFGVCLGWGLAQGSVRLVSRTVNALYYANNVAAARLDAGEAAVAILLAVVVSLFAGWIPARQAASTPPAQLLASGTGLIGKRWPVWEPVAGLLLLAAAFFLALTPPIQLSQGGRFPLAGYFAALLGVIGAGVVAGSGLGILGRLLAPLSERSAVLELGSSHVKNPTGRHRWAVAGLLCAVAMTGGMSILVSSFEKSVSQWIQHTLQSDLYLTSDANQAATSNNHVPSATWRAICSKPEVADADTALIIPVTMNTGNLRLVGANLGFSQRHDQFTWVQPPDSALVFDNEKNQSLCVVSETYSNRFRAAKGGRVSIPTPNGMVSLEIAGVYTDYGDEQGVVFADAAHVSRWFNRDDVTTLALVLNPGFNADAFRDSLRREYPGVAVFTNMHLRGEVIRIFRQTFAITYALEGIGVVVALAGLGVTLASILAERRAELTTLRALGMTHNEIASTAAWEGGLLAVCGSVGGLLASLALGMLLIKVINKQTFGWTLQSAFPWRYLASLGLAVIACGGAVAWTVGRWGSALPADQEA